MGTRGRARAPRLMLEGMATLGTSCGQSQSLRQLRPDTVMMMVLSGLHP